MACIMWWTIGSDFGGMRGAGVAARGVVLRVRREPCSRLDGERGGEYFTLG